MAEDAMTGATSAPGGRVPSFAKTLRRLRTSSDRSSRITIALAASGALAWLAWFFGAVLPVYEVTDTARVEAFQEAHSLDAPVAGRLAMNELVIGRHVEAGEVVAELDTALERAQLIEEQARLAAIEPELDAVKREIEAREQALNHEQSMLGFAIDEAKSRQREAQLSDRRARNAPDQDPRRLERRAARSRDSRCAAHRIRSHHAQQHGPLTARGAAT
jgi:multidrug efflux pump subunit AcrA (membrane-fusion protein)